MFEETVCPSWLSSNTTCRQDIIRVGDRMKSCVCLSWLARNASRTHQVVLNTTGCTVAAISGTFRPQRSAWVNNDHHAYFSGWRSSFGISLRRRHVPFTVFVDKTFFVFFACPSTERVYLSYSHPFAHAHRTERTLDG